MRGLRAAIALGLSSVTGAQAQDAAENPPSPDLDFLEYLGTWAEEDDEWLAIEEWEKDNGAKPGDEDPESAPPQKDDDDESE